MASEIIVQTIKGPSSGANANKIIVPSGQTLDASSGSLNASGGLTTPAGHVIGVAHGVSSYFSVNSTGPTLIMSLQYIPKVTGSKLLITGMSPRYQNNSSQGTWHSSAYMWLTQNSVSVASFEHVGTQTHSGESSENVPFDYFTDAVTAGTTYTFGLYHEPTNGGTSTWQFGRNINFFSGSAPCHTRMTIQEIAQ